MADADTDTLKNQVQEHYLSQGRKRGPSKPHRPQKPCQYEPCSDWARAQGYCFVHYQKMRKAGVIQAKRIKNDPVGRFNSRYKINKLSGCWEWTGWIHPKGYGILDIGGQSKKVRAHRFSWELHRGPIPDGMFVCHKCDNRKCCNPDHLFLGDDTANVRDMVAKGRHGCQTGSSYRKITPAMAQNIRVMFARGEHSMVALAGIYRVDHRTISDVIKGRAHQAV